MRQIGHRRSSCSSADGSADAGGGRARPPPRWPARSRGRRSRRSTPSATGASTEVWRNGSRAAGFDRCSSTTTPSKAASASCSDHEVWREGAGVDHDGRGPAPGAVDGLDQLALVVRTGRARARARSSAGRAWRPRHVVGQGRGAVDLGLALAEQVEVGPRQQQHDRAPSVIASRLPSPARVARTSAGVDAPHRLDAPGAVEHEGEVVVRLLVPAHERDQRSAAEPAGQVGRQVEAGDHPRCSATRSSSMRPSRRASRAAKTRPTATASPWRRSSRRRVGEAAAASRAWARVWP